MALDGINGIHGDGQIQKPSNPNIKKLAQKIKLNLEKFEGGVAQRKVTQEHINKALNETNSQKALTQLIANSPVGFGNQSTATELESLGYLDSGLRMHHIGAPISYESKDGGTVTVYDSGFIGNDGKLHTDAGPRTTVYKNGNFEQTMIYDENGKLTGGKIIIKNKIAGFTEREINFTVTADGKIAAKDEEIFKAE